jgi:hypothetical protein
MHLQADTLYSKSQPLPRGLHIRQCHLEENRKKGVQDIKKGENVKKKEQGKVKEK